VGYLILEQEDIMQNQNRGEITPEDKQKISFWVMALLQGANPARAAQELYSIGVRTRGAVRTRGSAQKAAPSRFPPDTPIAEILRLLKDEAPPEVRSGVASALAELGGPEALDVLMKLVVGEQRDSDPAIRAAALDAIGIIGGPEAINILEQVIASEDDATLKGMAECLIEPLRQG
jgi:hypothetical protein